MSVDGIQAIDVHAHYGIYLEPGRPSVERFMTGDAATVVRRAGEANTQYTIVSPLLGLLPRGKADAAAGNDEAAEVVAGHEGLLQWVIIDPRRPRTFEQADAMLKVPQLLSLDAQKYAVRKELLQAKRIELMAKLAEIKNPLP